MTSESAKRYADAKKAVQAQYANCELEFHEIRKVFALIFTSEENREYAPVLFSMLDGKDNSVVIWKKVREMTRNG